MSYGAYNMPGVGPDAPTVENAEGARQSSTPYRFDLTPPLALAKIAMVQSHGADKYGEWNWMGIPTEDHLNHALAHIHAYVAGDVQEGDVVEHLGHAACRILYALDTAIRVAAAKAKEEALQLQKEREQRHIIDDGFINRQCYAEPTDTETELRLCEIMKEARARGVKDEAIQACINVARAHGRY